MKSMSRRFTSVAASTVILGFFLTGSLAQQRPERPKLPSSTSRQEERPQKDDEAIRLGRTLVTLDVTVVDASNKPAMDLKEADFVVTEDKVPQKIEFFSREQVAVSLVFTIDTSGSMRPKLDTVIEASTSLVKDSRKDDEMAVIE